YLVPSAAIFGLDPTADAVLRALTVKPQTRTSLLASFRATGVGADVTEDLVDEAIAELRAMQAIGEVEQVPRSLPKVLPLTPVPLTTMVLNVTNQCNLACTYCYEYGEDKIVDTENGKKPKFMSEATARQSVEFMLKESGDNKVARVTFFGG